ncbi:MAG: MFS transporter [Bacilli bacterium]|nr:MFS transporter [Bacilli bacterium]
MFEYKESNILLMIEALKKIIKIFLGPFLTAYFIKVSADSLVDISLYYIFNYLILGIGFFILGWFLKKRHHLETFRTGIVINFIYILVIVILKEKIIDYIPLISLLSGMSSCTYYYPYNLFASSKVKNVERDAYEMARKVLMTFVSIVIPILLGSIISTTNFQLTAVIILIVSILQIILSLLIEPLDMKNNKYTPFKSAKILFKNKDIRNMLFVDFFKGMNLSDSALDILMVVLIVGAFNSDFSLGLFTSLSSVLVIVMQYLYAKIFNKKYDKVLAIISSIIPLIALVIMLFFNNDITLMIYYFSYMIMINMLALIFDVRLFNISNCKLIKEKHLLEFWSIREVVLNIGRVTGFTLLLIAGILSKKWLLYVLLFMYTFTILLASILTGKVKRYDSIK